MFLSNTPSEDLSFIPLLRSVQPDIIELTGGS